MKPYTASRELAYTATLRQHTDLNGTCVHALLVAGTVIAAQMRVCEAAMDCGVQVSLGPAEPRPLME